MIILDTDHFSAYPFTESTGAQILRSRLAASGDPDVMTSIITFEEQMRGWMAKINRVHEPTEQVSIYARLLRLAVFFREWAILPYDTSAAREFTRLRRQHRRLGPQDLKIAAIALTNDALLLCANLRDFRQISGLRVENWLAISPANGEE